MWRLTDLRCRTELSVFRENHQERFPTRRSSETNVSIRDCRPVILRITGEQPWKVQLRSKMAISSPSASLFPASTFLEKWPGRGHTFTTFAFQEWSTEE